MWNEVATIFLITIVMLATVKQSFSFVWGILGTLALILVLLLAIRVYKKIRS
jgi:putative membrane protein